VNTPATLDTLAKAGRPGADPPALLLSRPVVAPAAEHCPEVALEIKSGLTCHIRSPVDSVDKQFIRQGDT
jgi:hypothetical protein